MTEQNIFDPKNIKDAVERKRLLDELGLPPKMTAFIRNNAKKLQIGTVVCVVLILTWVSMDAYRDNQRSQSATELAAALKIEDNSQRIEMLDKVITKFSGTDAARWSETEKAHLAASDHKDEAAIGQYEKVLADLSADSPQVPLMQYSLAVSYENTGNKDKAGEYYQKVAEKPGFTALADLALGRMSELAGDKAKALEFYKKANDSETAGSQLKTILISKIHNLELAAENEDI